MNAILVPGRPDKDQHYDPNRPSNNQDFWFGWLQRQLILKDIHAVSVEPPFPFRPRYEEWRREFERFDVNQKTILIGHSCGGGFLVRYLSEHKNLQVGKVFLVAPWINPDNNSESDTADFFDFEIDGNFPERTRQTSVYISSDDYSDVVKTVEILKEKVRGLTFHEFSDRGHFTKNAPDPRAFPELLEEILK